MSTTTATAEPVVNGVDHDRIDKSPHLTHTSTNISISPELFEKLYLNPKVPHAGDHGRYANATPLGFLGYVLQPGAMKSALTLPFSFVIATFTFSMVLMGWGGASGLPAVA